MDSNAALEYQTFKIPYETLNKQFRETQKSLGRQRARIQDAKNLLDTKLTAEKPITLDEVAAPLAEFKNRVSMMDSLIEKAYEEQADGLHDLQHRAHYLHTGVDGSLTSIEQWMWNKERVDRLVLQHLLRCGHLETARAFAEKTGLGRLCDISIFEKADLVEKSLLNGQTGPCLEWLHEHRSRLRRLTSTFETEIRSHDVMELVREGRRLEALKYVRRFLAQSLQEGNEKIRKLMAAIACGVESKAFRELDSPKGWEELVRLFRMENARIYQLPEQSIFSACLQTGICAHKTPSCAPNANPNCIACDTTVHTLAADLPFANVSNSKLLCGLTGEPLDEKNVPMMLESGRVYGEKAVLQLREGDYIRCPRTNTKTHVKQLARLFIL
ncbi:unnamed protein product, partial [Mesorhabditis belari]|uniref:E3 ubiquitin-protein transferase MAEA n=1 Tax=Mesorhabditis belari TaxID=2138241 RepID=A0AAF3FAI2_9BILA